MHPVVERSAFQHLAHDHRFDVEYETFAVGRPDPGHRIGLETHRDVLIADHQFAQMIHHGHQLAFGRQNFTPAPAFDPFEKVHCDILVFERHRLVDITALLEMRSQAAVGVALRAVKTETDNAARTAGKNIFFISFQVIVNPLHTGNSRGATGPDRH